MRFSPALLLPALAAAAPVANVEASTGSGPFTLMSVRSASPVHLQQVNATGQAFFIGKPTATYCPSGVSGLDCSQFNKDTTVVGTSDVGKASGAYLADTVPGGQNLYVQKNGALGFTQAHSGAIPEGAYTTGFVYTAPTSSSQPWGHLTFTGHGATGLFACPAGTNVYQVFADVTGFKNKSKCLGFDAFAIPYNGTSAWQYT
ncbi:MAG: hypothetical protein GOMPHAMPRED_000036 [Gomphillus americanus]|uniref:IgE-binding protein n=1 Tax=Gomphillus americanus TaxID=1940652 RepID=A0A8H3I4H1_9LECA|nr:MAG: hypothetical protein GOMPHAMPRED_000036 [Gomphillus americanus]